MQHNIGVILKNLTFHSLGEDFLRDIVRALHDAKRAHVMEVEFFDTNMDIGRFIDTGEYERFSGFIGCLPANDAASAREWRRLETLRPCVLAFSEPADTRSSRNYAGSDEVAGIACVVDHIVKEGGKAIGFCSFGNERYTLRRYKGFRQGVAHHELPLQRSWVNGFDIGDGSFIPSFPEGAVPSERVAARENVYRSIMRIKRLDAVIFETDQYAAEFAVCAQKGGVYIPEDIMIAGFNNSRTFLGREPFITSVDQHVRKISRTALELLFDIIAGRRERSGNEVLVAPKIILRASTMRGRHAPGMSDKKMTTSIRSLIKKHFADRDPSRTIASRLALTPGYFLKRYRTLFGVSFVRAVNDMRLASAARSLSATGKSITHIYMENGFTNHVHFNKMFKRTFGMTAKRYRETNVK